MARVRHLQRSVTGKAEVEAGLDIGTLFLKHHDGEFVHGVSRRGRVPELDVIDVAVSDILPCHRDEAGSGEEHLALEIPLGDEATGAGRGRHGGAEDARHLRVGGQGLLQLVVVLIGVVVGLEPAGHQLHVGEVLLLVLDGAVDPFVLRLRGQAADGRDVIALAAHLLAEVLHQLGAIGLVVESLDVEVDVLDVRRLVRDHHDAAVPRLLEHRLDGFDREGHHADGVDALGDQILDDLDLGGGVGLARADLVGVLARVRLELLHTLAHAVEPGDAVDLDHGGDRVGLAGGRGPDVLGDLGRVEGPFGPGRPERNRQGQSGDGGRRHQLQHVSFLPGGLRFFVMIVSTV